MTRENIFREVAPKFRKIKSVTNVNTLFTPRTSYMRIFFRYKTERTYNRIRREVIEIIEKNPKLKYMSTQGVVNLNPNLKYDYCFTVIKINTK